MGSHELARSFFAHWAELEHAASVARLGGGELKDVFRVDCEGGAYALRVYTPDVSPDDVAWELALVSPFAKRLREVAAPIATADGAALAVEGGRVAVLRVPPVRPRSFDERGQHRHASALDRQRRAVRRRDRRSYLP